MPSNYKIDDRKLRKVAIERGMRRYSKVPRENLLVAVRNNEKQHNIIDFY